LYLVIGKSSIGVGNGIMSCVCDLHVSSC
jgi:hypothetical protein